MTSAGKPDRAPAAAASDLGDDDRRERPFPAGRAVVTLDVTPEPRREFFRRESPSAPYLTQLIANRENGSAGERRGRRADDAVAPRAAEAYAGAGRLASRIEPGFLHSRSA